MEGDEKVNKLGNEEARERKNRTGRWRRSRRRGGGGGCDDDEVFRGSIDVNK